MLTAVSILLATALSAQSYTLSGRIQNAFDQSPLEYATISAYQPDSTLVEGTISEADGQFSLQLPVGEYRLDVAFIGFQPQVLPVNLQANQQLPTILLESDKLTLDEVEVTAEKSQMNLLLDKKVFNIGQDVLAQGGSANDVLAQLPSVAVSVEGQISLRGNSGVNVLINGRPSALAANNALNSIPAESIEKVEIITNPSARYEAAGTAGIINIILKKEQQAGYGGTVSIQTGYDADHQLNANFNWRRKRYNGFANFGTRYSNYNGLRELDRMSSLEGVFNRLDLDMDQDRNDQAIGGYAGIDYQLTPQRTLSGSYSLYRLVNDDIATTDYSYSGADGAPQESWQQTLDYLEPGTYHQIDVTYSQEYAREGSELNVYFRSDMWFETEDEDVRIAQNFPSEFDLLRYRTNTKESSRDFMGQADYQTPIGENGFLEAGLRGETRIITADYLVEQNVDDVWNVLADFDNKLDYFERVGAAYFQYRYKKGAWAVQAGLRNEYTHVKVEGERESIVSTDKQYNRLFPSLSLSHEFSERTTAQLSHSRRIWRPRFWQLNPFRGISDPTQLFLGNPDLDPTFTDRVEISLLQNWDKVTFNPTLYASTTTDFFGYVIEQEAANLFDVATGTITTRPVNLERENFFGLELNANYRPNDIWTIAGEFYYHGYQQRGEALGRNFDFDFSSWRSGLRLQANLPNDISIQARGVYSAPYKDVQQIRRAQYFGSFGISKRWDNRWTLSLNSRSPRWNETQVFRPSFVENEYQSWTRWRYSVRLQYRFEKGESSRERRQRGSIR